MEDVSKAYSSTSTALPLAFRITLYLQGMVPSFPQANLFAKLEQKVKVQLVQRLQVQRFLKTLDSISILCLGVIIYVD